MKNFFKKTTGNFFNKKKIINKPPDFFLLKNGLSSKFYWSEFWNFFNNKKKDYQSLDRSFLAGNTLKTLITGISRENIISIC